MKITEAWPLSAQAENGKGLAISILLYVVVSVVMHFVLGLLGFLPIINIIADVLRWVLDVYCGAGVIISLLIFFKVVR